MHATILFFTQRGRCYWMKVYDIPEGNKTSKGRAIQNVLNIDSNDKVNAFIRVKKLEDPEFNESHYLVFCTRQGIVKKTRLSEYSRPRQNGINAITIREDDRVVEVHLTGGHDEILLANRNGRAIRFNEENVREMGRLATGVRGMQLDDGDDEVVGMITMTGDSEDNVLVVSEQGYGKRSRIDTYRITNRGGKGVKTINITEKTGRLVAIKNVNDENDLMIINKSGIVLRLTVEDLNIIGRASQGVKLINLGKRNDQIASVCVVPTASDDEAETVTDETVSETTVNNDDMQM